MQNAIFNKIWRFSIDKNKAFEYNTVYKPVIKNSS